MDQADADFLHAIQVECTGWALGSAFVSRHAASHASKALYRKIKYKTVAILRSGALLVGGVATSVVCVGAEQRVYDATIEGLMSVHAIKTRQLFEEW